MATMKVVWGIVIGLVVIAAVVMYKGDVVDYSMGTYPTPSVAAVVSQAPAVNAQARATVRPVVKTEPKTVSYEDALKLYAGVRIQFDATCQASPNKITVKKGTSVMFDNRSGDARWISIDGTGYQIAGYGFRVIAMNPSVVPHSVVLGCGSAINVGSVNVQN